MPRRTLTDAALLASIREATAAWNAPQDTAYYAKKHRISPARMGRRLRALEQAGALEIRRDRAEGRYIDTWLVRETP